MDEFRILFWHPLIKFCDRQRELRKGLVWKKRLAINSNTNRSLHLNFSVIVKFSRLLPSALFPFIHTFQFR